ncbi:RHS repeat domain-containing protein [Apibacter adventoris]|uniref:RHS repeat domain-containing protein n=1 Tax=Apibacter adventoris TaxID=1679466 RepID=UPI0021A4A283|nr:RHS repeat-associated core domain-containing protein [Apibacter adventoris]
MGSSSYITNLDAQIVQHVAYVPYGEVFIEERNQSWNTPYLFKGKELDEETGLYYYGARYYNPRESVWLSVDPLAEMFPNISPYAYANLNPVNYTDPTGMAPADPPEKELPGITVTPPKNKWIRGAGIWNNIFKHSNRIRAEQYNKQNFGGSGTVTKVGKGKFTVEASATVDVTPGNGPYNEVTDLNISARFGTNSDEPNLDFSISQRNVSSDGALIYTGFGFDPGLADAAFAYLDKESNEGDSQIKKYALGSLGLIISKGKGVGSKTAFWITKSTYQTLAGISPKLLDQMLRAGEKGFVRAKGVGGIKQLAGKGIEGRIYEIKLGRGQFGSYRILGNMGTHNGKPVIIFDKLINK